MATLNDLVKQHGLVGVTFISPRGEKLRWEQRAIVYQESNDGYSFEKCYVDPKEAGWVVKEPEYVETRWVNVDEGYPEETLYDSRTEADEGAWKCNNRIACVKVEIRWRCGQYDE